MPRYLKSFWCYSIPYIEIFIFERKWAIVQAKLKACLSGHFTDTTQLQVFLQLGFCQLLVIPKRIKCTSGSKIKFRFVYGSAV